MNFKLFSDASIIGAQTSWHSFVAWLFFGLIGALAVCFFLILITNPYRNIPFMEWNKSPMMDKNQRYQYPSLARDEEYDSAVFGTSTGRLLSPHKLESVFGGNFAQMSMNAAIAYEQYRLAKLYIYHHQNAKKIIVTLDEPWCVTGTSFPKFSRVAWPEWMYDDNPWNDLPNMLNGKTVETAARTLLHHIGIEKARYDDDGYRDFTVVFRNIDSEQILKNLYGSLGKREPKVDESLYSSEELDDLNFPTHPMLKELVALASKDTKFILAFMPYHYFYQGAVKSKNYQRFEICKKRIVELFLRAENVSVVDFMFHSKITMLDDNYWDLIHYKKEVADILVRELFRGKDSELMKVLK